MAARIAHDPPLPFGRAELEGGTYMALPKPGFIRGLAPMSAEPVGDIHWAGAETALDHPGYLDGAIESGQRAAMEVMQALTGQSAAASP